MSSELAERTVEYLQVLQGMGQTHVVLDAGAVKALRSRTTRPSAKAAEAPAPQKVVREAVAPAPSARPTEIPVSTQVLSPAEKQAALDELASHIRSSQECKALFRRARNMVFGVGNIHADIMFIGEAPGAEEDEQGEPFVGKAGQLLTKMIEAMGVQRSDVYIANVVKFRPDMPPGSMGNRKPTLEEVEACRPFICTQIDLIRPKVMVALGATAIEGLLSMQKAGITRMRGQWLEFRGIPLMPTFHPAYLLRNDSTQEKRKVWEDLLQVMGRAGLPISEKQRNFFLKK